MRGGSGDTREKVAPNSEALDARPNYAEDHEESDDETSVSSITNPTYQSVRAPHDYVQVQNPFVDKSNFANPYAPPPSNPFGPSTSTFRRPRPSHLQSYAHPTNHEVPAVLAESRSKEKRRILQEYPPPNTIKVNNPPSQSSTQDLNQSVPFDESPNEAPRRKLDNFMSNSHAAIAEKIRVWDEMSNGISKTKSEDSRKQDPETQEQEESAEYHSGDDVVTQTLPSPPPSVSRRLIVLC